MGLSIFSNIASARNNRFLNRADKEVNNSFERLSSGRRVNSAADDAVALQIAASLEAQIQLEGQAARDTSDLSGAIAIAQGGLDQASAIAGRVAELAVAASSDTVGAAGRTAIQAEITQLTQELDRISQTTSFNGQQLLASDSTITAQVGTDGTANSQLSVSFQAVSSASLGLDSIDVSTAEGARAAVDSATAAVDSVTQAQGRLGASDNRLRSAFNTLQTQRVQNAAAQSRLIDADIAEESANLTANSIRQQASAAVAGQANAQPALALSLLGRGGGLPGLG